MSVETEWEEPIHTDQSTSKINLGAVEISSA